MLVHLRRLSTNRIVVLKLLYIIFDSRKRFLYTITSKKLVKLSGCSKQVTKLIEEFICFAHK